MASAIALHPEYEEMIYNLVNKVLKSQFGKVAYCVDILDKPVLKDEKIIISLSVRFISTTRSLFEEGVFVEIVLSTNNEKLSVYSIHFADTQVDQKINPEPVISSPSQSGLTDQEKEWYVQDGFIKIPKTGYYEPR